MTKTLLLFLGILISAGVFAQNDLFFSEYIEGSNNNKGMEVYNPTSETIDLTMYYIVRFSNGGSTYSSGGATQLTGTLEPYKTFVLINGQTISTETSPGADPVLQAMATQLDGDYPAPTYMNGNDAIALMKTETGDISDALPVDLFGQIGLGSKISKEYGWGPYNDTTITYTISDVEYQHTISDFVIKKKDDSNDGSGPYWMAWSMDHTLRRKYEVFKGVVNNPEPFDITLEWDTVSVSATGVNEVTGEEYTFRKYEDIWDDLGKHECIVTEPDFKSSVKTIENSSIKIFPTLVNERSFKINAAENIKSVEMYNIKGVRVFSGAYTQKDISIDVSNLNSGIYLVKTTTENNKQRAIRIVIQ